MDGCTLLGEEWIPIQIEGDRWVQCDGEYGLAGWVEDLMGVGEDEAGIEAAGDVVSGVIAKIHEATMRGEMNGEVYPFESGLDALKVVQWVLEDYAPFDDPDEVKRENGIMEEAEASGDKARALLERIVHMRCTCTWAR